MNNVLDEFQINQQKETILQEKTTGPFSYRYAYARSAESQSAGEPGQDYLIFRCSDNQFVFAICDGVGLSFNGEIAAEFLGNKLCHWLQSSTLDNRFDQINLQKEFAEFLKSLVPEASLLINRLEIDEQISGFHREVLEEKRDHGSETTFVCGRIDLSPEVGKENRLMLAWQGDSKIRMWGVEEEQTHILGNRFLTEQRWSTKRGPVGGEPNLLVTKIPNEKLLKKLITYTDGLKQLDTLATSPSSNNLHEMIYQANKKAESDDLAFLEIEWATEKAVKEQKAHSLNLLFQHKRKQ